MELYWKVHINNFDFFINYILKSYKKFRNSDLGYFRYCYKHSDYIYLCIESYDTINTGYILSYGDYNNFTKDWLGSNHWVYMGEFYGRMNKLIMLDKISKL